ncbi:group II truncated hemoglobin [Aliikangiella sp. IMCC44653]
MHEILRFGQLDASFQAAGGEQGVRQLVDDFYDNMQSIKRAKAILEMHPADLEVSRDKLFRFLCGWLGGPRLFQEKYGPISIPKVHAHLAIGESERDAWLLCMQQAVEKQPFSEEFKSYFMKQISMPANRVMNQ